MLVALTLAAAQKTTQEREVRSSPGQEEQLNSRGRAAEEKEKRVHPRGSQPATDSACIQIRPRRAAAQLRFLLPPSSPHRIAAEWRSTRACLGWHNSAAIDYLRIHVGR
ncbi:hypothetical protein PR202_gb02085 [Eleusine coracana subsp. coracana]|uniref:Uncharacterized protein n=1 Tax=Eleusine coracana subsp. coracana TaxID=191504 RepID=A0AAV5DY47_ELECO|nr:hypothetical protein PR202_gb02085 [Eleusine coracana subsp. coracana]